MKKLSLIFDMDGCLIDSKEVQKAAFFGSYKEVVGDDNCPSYEEYIKHTGDSIENVLKKMGLPVEMAGPYRRISSAAVDKVSVNWEVIDFIRDMKKTGCLVAICTGKDHYRAVDILKYYKIDDLFDVIVGADDVDEPKPSAKPILAAMKAMHSVSSETIVIGDGYNDIMSAQNAGVKSILTLWYGDEGVPRKSDYIASSASQLRSIFKQ